jgi:hypothetical protein
MCKWLCYILEYIPSDICLGVVSLDVMVVLFLVSQVTSILLSIAVALIYIPTNSVAVFLPLPHTSLPAFVVACIINVSYFDWGEMESQCSFDLHFLYGQGFWAFLRVFIHHLYFLLKIVCSADLLIYSVGFWFFEWIVFWVSCVLWLLIPCH